MHTHRGDINYRIIDTAGIRKKGKVEYGAEFFMINRAFKAVKRAEVVVLLLDALDGIVEQDRILAQRIAEEGRSCVIALNKWDIVPDKDDKTYIKAVENIRSNVPVLRWAEIVLISALTGDKFIPVSTMILIFIFNVNSFFVSSAGQRTEKLFEAVDRAAKQFSRRIPTAIINEVVQGRDIHQLLRQNVNVKSSEKNMKIVD